MGHRLDRWGALDWPERRQLFVNLLTLPCIDLSLRAFGYKRLLAWIELATPTTGANSLSEQGVKVGKIVASQVDLAGRQIPFFNTSCLRQALLVYWRLRRRGFAPSLRIGIRPLPGTLDAHAWVELDGVALVRTPSDHRAFIGKAGSPADSRSLS